MQSRNKVIMELDRSKAGQQIPDIQLTISEKYSIKKLQMTDDADALLADHLWIHYNRKDKSIPFHLADALTKENGAYFVLFEKNSDDSLGETDKVYAYAYVTKVSSDVLVFAYVDLYEKTYNYGIACDAFITLANQFIKRPDITKIQCGVSTIGKGYTIGIRDATLNSNGSSYRGSFGVCLDFLADKNLFVSSNNTREVVFDKRAFDAEIEKCDESKSITSKMRTNIRWIVSNNYEALLSRPIHSKLVETYVLIQENFKKQLQDYAESKKEFKLPSPSEEVDYGLSITNVTEGDRNSATATMLAAHFGHPEFLSELIKRLNNVCHENEHFRDALFYASAELNQAAEQNQEASQYEACVKKLLDAKASIDHSDYVGNTPIMLATVHNNVNQVKRLLEAKANINDLSGDFYTPLINAVWNYSNGNHSTADLLKCMIKSKADVNMQNINGNTALTCAVKWYRKKNREHRLNAMSLLIEAKADITIKNKKDETALSLAKKHNYIYPICRMEYVVQKERMLKHKNSQSLFKQSHLLQNNESEVDESQERLAKCHWVSKL